MPMHINNITIWEDYGKELINYIISELRGYGIEIELLNNDPWDNPWVDINEPIYKRQKSLYDIGACMMFFAPDKLTSQDKKVFEKFTDDCVYDFLQNNPSPDPNLIIRHEKWDYSSSKCLSQAAAYLVEQNGDYLWTDDWNSANGIGLYIRLGVKNKV